MFVVIVEFGGFMWGDGFELGYFDVFYVFDMVDVDYGCVEVEVVVLVVFVLLWWNFGEVVDYGCVEVEV